MMPHQRMNKTEAPEGDFEQVWNNVRTNKENYRKVGLHEWWTDYCSAHGKTSHSTAWGSQCIMCAKHVKKK